MKSTGSLVDQLEELVNEVIGLGDSLARTAEDLRMAQSFHPQGVVAELAEARKAMLDLSARLAQMEQFLSPTGGIASETVEDTPRPASQRDAISLRPAGPGESAPEASPSAASLRPKWEEADARLSGLSQLIQRALRAQSASDPQ